MINTLRPAMLDELGLTESLRELVSQWQSHSPEIECRLSLASDLSDLDESSEVTIYRVVQGALDNVAKHANASHVAIRLQEEKLGRGTTKRLVLSIEDDGVGMDMTRHPEGMGLASMRERLISLGGEFNVHSVVGKGTRITAAFPARKIEA
jgi:signal transduction histidine kinase